MILICRGDIGEGKTTLLKTVALFLEENGYTVRKTSEGNFDIFKPTKTGILESISVKRNE